jgi:hypothetical protein
MASIENIGRQFRGVVTLPIHEVHGFLSGDFHDDVAHGDDPLTVGRVDSDLLEGGEDDRQQENADLLASIKAHGVTEPVDAHILKDNRVSLFDGHHRVFYATKAGITHIPVRFS